MKKKRKEELKKYAPITVLIPAYNEEKCIKKTIDSIRNSKYPAEIEIIVIDDGSIDNTKKVAMQHGAKVLTQSHAGKAEALNKGLQHAKHEIVFVVDADTIVTKDAFRHMYSLLQKKDVACVSASLKIKNANTLFEFFQNVEYLHLSLLTEAVSYIFNTPMKLWGAVFGFKKTVINSIGGFKKTFAEDFHLVLELYKNGYKVLVSKILCETHAPKNLNNFVEQRKRWFIGNMQSMISLKSINYISLFHVFIYFYFIISLPLILYHFIYWIPFNLDIIPYTIRWFTLLGPFYMIYKIPEWGINYTYFFGVLSGIITAFLFILTIARYKQFQKKNLIAIFCFFPYFLFLSFIAFYSLLSMNKRGYFIK